MVRQYGEFDDVPTVIDGTFTDADRTKMLVSFVFSEGITRSYNIQPKVMKEYGLSEEEVVENAKWYKYYALIASYKSNNIDIWLRCHVSWPQSNNGRLVRKDPDGVRRIYGRLCVLSKEKRLNPN